MNKDRAWKCGEKIRCSTIMVEQTTENRFSGYGRVCKLPRSLTLVVQHPKKSCLFGSCLFIVIREYVKIPNPEWILLLRTYIGMSWSERMSIQNIEACRTFRSHSVASSALIQWGYFASKCFSMQFNIMQSCGWTMWAISHLTDHYQKPWIRCRRGKTGTEWGAFEFSDILKTQTDWNRLGIHLIQMRIKFCNNSTNFVGAFTSL